MRDAQLYQTAVQMSETFYKLGQAYSLLSKAIALGVQAELARLTAIEFLEEALTMLQAIPYHDVFVVDVTCEVNDALDYARSMKDEG